MYRAVDDGGQRTADSGQRTAEHNGTQRPMTVTRDARDATRAADCSERLTTTPAPIETRDGRQVAISGDDPDYPELRELVSRDGERFYLNEPRALGAWIKADIDSPNVAAFDPETGEHVLPAGLSNR